MVSAPRTEGHALARGSSPLVWSPDWFPGHFQTSLGCPYLLPGMLFLREDTSDAESLTHWSLLCSLPPSGPLVVLLSPVKGDLLVEIDGASPMGS